MVYFPVGVLGHWIGGTLSDRVYPHGLRGQNDRRGVQETKSGAGTTKLNPHCRLVKSNLSDKQHPLKEENLENSGDEAFAGNI